MDLKEFIKTALVDLIEGVNEAKDSLPDNICPSSSGGAFVDKANLVRDAHGLYIQTVHFDVAVTIENSTKGALNAGIKVLGIGAGVGQATDNNNTTESRIKFQVPISLGRRNRG